MEVEPLARLRCFQPPTQPYVDSPCTANFRKPDDANGPSRIPACLILPDQGRVTDPANKHDDQVSAL
jgi:hypothetical protein